MWSYENWKGWFKHGLSHGLETLRYFYPFSYPTTINDVVSLRLTKRKHQATLFPAGFFNYRRSESAFLSGCTMTNHPELVSDTAGVTLFCLVNRIFAQSCACVAIRGWSTSSERARVNAHRRFPAACLWLAVWNFICSPYMHLLLITALCSNFATSKKMLKEQIYSWKFLMRLI